LLITLTKYCIFSLKIFTVDQLQQDNNAPTTASKKAAVGLLPAVFSYRIVSYLLMIRYRVCLSIYIKIFGKNVFAPKGVEQVYFG